MQTCLKAKTSQSFPLNLNNDNDYYSAEANWQYMSVSQYKKFVECEAAALAELKEEWKPESDPIALLVGNYVHSYFESPEVHERFKEKNRSLIYADATVAQYKKALDSLGLDYKKTAKKEELVDIYESIEGDKPFLHGKIYRDFSIAEQMINRVEDEPLFHHLWKGEREVPVTGKLFGIDWKGKIDLLNIKDGYFIDLKTNAKFDKRYWSKDYGRYVSFVESFGYVLQLAVYEKLLEKRYGKPFEGFIFAVSKETPSNVEAIYVDEHKKDFELSMLEERIDHIDKVKMGQKKPKKCGKCEYCRGHKTITDFIESSALIE